MAKVSDLDLPALREAVAVSQTPIRDYDTEAFHRRVEAEKLLLNAFPALLHEVELLRTCNEILRRNNLTLKDDSHALDVLRVEQRQLVERWNKANIEREDNAQRLVAELTKAEAALATALEENEKLREDWQRISGDVWQHTLDENKAARAVLDHAIVIEGPGDVTLQVLDRAAWLAWQGRT